MQRSQRPIILGVTESDCHVVANRLIELQLRADGWSVLNLGVCTPVAEFAAAYAEHPDTPAILIGSLNGHGYDDLQTLPRYRERYDIHCPIVLGGNLSVGSQKTHADETRFYALGVTHILRELCQILPLLATFMDAETARIVAASADDRTVYKSNTTQQGGIYGRSRNRALYASARWGAGLSHCI
ncbi:MAG: cobalamin B12-binding domain-containing protein [Deltaproteobacteria bacterium]|nr:cobalamin B12-binding domain-containing protein [Deltaproteobacteria bacterium]